jgi:hypothetical protein
MLVRDSTSPFPFPVNILSLISWDTSMQNHMKGSTGKSFADFSDQLLGAGLCLLTFTRFYALPLGGSHQYGSIVAGFNLIIRYGSAGASSSTSADGKGEVGGRRSNGRSDGQS